MNDWLSLALLVTLGAAAVGLVVDLVRDDAADDRVFGVLVTAEVLVVVQAILGCVLVARGEPGLSTATFLSYLLSLPLVLPIGAFWSLAERNRSGTTVLLVAALTVAAMQLRLLSLWGGAGA